MPRDCLTFAALCWALSACAGGSANTGAATSPSVSAGTGGAVSVGGGSVFGGSGGGAGQSNAALAIDFSIWSLQLPTGSGTSPTTISPTQLLAGYADAYFYVAADGAQTFMDPQTGVTTSGSLHCRSEMREDNPDGSPAAWAATGTSRMLVAGKVIQVGGGSSGRVTLGQIFNGSDSIPLCELSYSVAEGGFDALYEEAKGAGTTTPLNTPVSLNESYEFELALTNGMLTVSINSKQAYSHALSSAVAAKSFYFKVGNYDQTAISGAISSTPYTVVEASSVQVTHE